MRSTFLHGYIFFYTACGVQCTHDGVHYSNATYDALVQVMGNMLGAML